MDKSEQIVEFKSYNHFSPPETVTFDESHVKFPELVELIETLDVRHWDEEYQNPRFLEDGRKWWLRICLPGFQRSMHGINAYPEGFDELEAWVNAHTR